MEKQENQDNFDKQEIQNISDLELNNPNDELPSVLDQINMFKTRNMKKLKDRRQRRKYRGNVK